MKNDQRPCAVEAWALYNFATTLLGTYPLRRLAKLEAEERSGEPWAKCRNYYQIVRVTVTPEA